MMAAQLVAFLVMTFRRLPCRVRFVAMMVVTRSRSDSVHSVARGFGAFRSYRSIGSLMGERERVTRGRQTSG